MFKKEHDLKWEFLEEEDQDKPRPPLPPATQRSLVAHYRLVRRRILVLAAAMAILLTAGIGTIYARNEAQKGIAEVEEGVQAAVDAEEWVQAHAPELSADMLVDDAASDYVKLMAAGEQHLLAAVTRQESPATTLRVSDTRFRGPNAAADVTLTLPAQGDVPQSFRQTRFYRETPQGWLRTQPLPVLWGQPRSHETDNLAWRYRQRDEETVLAVAEEMDALYAQWRRDHGLYEPPGQRLAVDVRVDRLPAQATLQRQAEAEVTIASPSVYLAPSSFSDEEILVQSATVAMVQSLWAEVIAEGTTDRAYTVLSGLHMWEMMDAEMPLVDYSGDFIKSYVTETGSQANDGTPPLPPESVREICAAFGVWMIRPTALQIPVYCELTDSSSMVHRTFLDSPRIPSVLAHSYEQRLNHVAPWVRTLLFATVIDYAVAAHGRESLPAFVSALGEHESWQTLVPAVFGVPFDEFEQGWREHLAAMAE